MQSFTMPAACCASERHATIEEGKGGGVVRTALCLLGLAWLGRGQESWRRQRETHSLTHLLTPLLLLLLLLMRIMPATIMVLRDMGYATTAVGFPHNRERHVRLFCRPVSSSFLAFCLFSLQDMDPETTLHTILLLRSATGYPTILLVLIKMPRLWFDDYCCCYCCEHC